MERKKYNFPIERCPNCGGTTIVIKQRILGYGEYYVDLETEEIEASELHSGLTYRNTGKWVTCADCGRRLFKVDDYLNVIE